MLRTAQSAETKKPEDFFGGSDSFIWDYWDKSFIIRNVCPLFTPQLNI